MAESDKATSLSQDYLLKDKEEKVDVVTETVEKTAEKDAVDAAPETPVTENVIESSASEAAVNETVPQSVDPAAEENVGATDDSDKAVTEAATADSKESEENADEGNAASDETPEIKLETAPGDYRFPTTNQSRHCFTRYVEYHRCVAAKGEDASECEKFAKYYRSLCPGEWIDKWNEQRENGTFPGPL